ncbi:MAG: tyrosine-type recombinase/integrase, partial [Bradyrhizobium sp.]|nr:tyrosine-type recombinase/integrase [Bradyrhizobium sp.]
MLPKISNLPHRADKRLADLKASDLATWRDSRLKEVSGETIRRTASAVSHALRLARHDWGWMTHNPMDGFRGPQSSPPRDRLITWREIRAMLKAMRYTGGTPKNKTQEVAVAFLIALRTGMRAGEVLQVGRETADLDRRVVRIEQHKTRNLTGKARVVPITKKAARVIARIERFTVKPQSLDSMFRKARERAGLS